MHMIALQAHMPKKGDAYCSCSDDHESAAYAKKDPRKKDEEALEGIHRVL